MTASTLYEAVEPPVLWKQLLSALFEEITGDGSRTEVGTHMLSPWYSLQLRLVGNPNGPLHFENLCARRGHSDNTSANHIRLAG
jgi:hypothetical protein